MVMTTDLLLYAVVFVAAFLLIEGLYYVVADSGSGGRGKINRRLRMLAAGTDAYEVLSTLRRESRGKGGAWFAKYVPLLAAFDRLVSQANIVMPTGRVLQIMAGLFFGTLFTHALMKNGITTGSFLWAGLAGIVLPVFYLRRRRKTYLAKFGEQLPEALDMIVRSLRAGHPISAGLSMVAREMADPIGTQFGIAVDEMTYGLDLKEALEHMGDRVGHSDLQYVVVSINIQDTTGGNLAEVLDGLSRVIRGRFHLYRKVRALSAEGRMSAYLLSVLPFLVGGLIWLINPGYYQQYAEDPTFHTVLLTGFVVMVIGIFMMYKMVNFRV